MFCPFCVPLLFLVCSLKRTALGFEPLPSRQPPPLPAPLSRGLLSSGLFGSHFMPCRCHRLAALSTRPCFANTSFSCLSFRLSACVRIDLPVLFMTHFCREIFCRHGIHVVLDLLRLYCRYLCPNIFHFSLLELRFLSMSVVLCLVSCVLCLVVHCNEIGRCFDSGFG